MYIVIIVAKMVRKGKQRFDEFDYNRTTVYNGTFIYIFERPTESLTLLDIRFNVTQNAGRRCYWISEIRNDHVSMLLGKCIKSKVNKSDSSWFTIIYPLFQPL